MRKQTVNGYHVEWAREEALYAMNAARAASRHLAWGDIAFALRCARWEGKHSERVRRHCNAALGRPEAR